MQLRYPQGVLGSYQVSLRSWAADEFRLQGSHGMLAFDGSIVRPHGLRASHEQPLQAEQADLGWRGRLRQHALVHSLAQRLGRSSRARGVLSHHRYAGNGYHYQADEVRACVQRGALQSDVMPWADSVHVAMTAQSVRHAVHAAAAAALPSLQ
jgi:hypothetical protein